MTATRASLIAAIGVILQTAYELWLVIFQGRKWPVTLAISSSFVLIVFSIGAVGLGWTLFLLAFHSHRGQISADVRRAARIAAWLVLADMIAAGIYSRGQYLSFFLGAVATIPALAVLVAFALTRIWLIRAASLAFALVELPALIRAWKYNIHALHVFPNLIGTAIRTLAWISIVGFLLAFGATGPRSFGEDGAPGSGTV